MKKLKITVHGHVQGIGFRFSAMQAAYKFGIRGFVENHPDGSVYLEAEGAENALEEFLLWCKKGPVGARVERVETETVEPGCFTRFDIR